MEGFIKIEPKITGATKVGQNTCLIEIENFNFKKKVSKMEKIYINKEIARNTEMVIKILFCWNSMKMNR